MRVISGTARGTKLFSLDGNNTRPTTDKVKEAVFSMILPHVCGASVLDLFSGSGALGIEALSRGADKAVFTDISYDAIRIIKRNVEQTNVGDRAQVIKRNALDYLKSNEDSFDIIFLDPPYKSGLYGPVLKEIKKQKKLNTGGVIVCEHAKENVIESDFVLLKCKSYGTVSVSVLGEEV